MRGSVTGLTFGSHKPELRVQVPSAQLIFLKYFIMKNELQQQG